MCLYWNGLIWFQLFTKNKNKKIGKRGKWRGKINISTPNSINSLLTPSPRCRADGDKVSYGWDGWDMTSGADGWLRLSFPFHRSEKQAELCLSSKSVMTRAETQPNGTDHLMICGTSLPALGLRIPHGSLSDRRLKTYTVKMWKHASRLGRLCSLSSV